MGGENIRDRTFRFACDVVLAARPMGRRGDWSLANQLIRSACAVGANLAEAKAASSKREFTRICEIALREAHEAHYWLRLCLALRLLDVSSQALEREADEVVRILSTIVIRSKINRVAKATLAVVVLVAAIFITR